jgi:hypothetical protein
MTNAGFNQASSLSFASFAAICALVWAASLAPAAAQGTPEQQQACQPDAMRLCSEFIPDIPKITACMAKKRTSLSPACRAVFTHPTVRRRRSTRT